MEKIIDFGKKIYKKLELEEQNEVYIDGEKYPDYEKDEYDDLISIREIKAIMDLSQELINKYNKTFEGIFEDTMDNTEEYMDFTKRLMQNYIEFKYPDHLFMQTNALIDETLERFKRCKLETANKKIRDLKIKYGII